MQLIEHVINEILGDASLNIITLIDEVLELCLIWISKGVYVTLEGHIHRKSENISFDAIEVSSEAKINVH
jgi:hypothetical protein